MRKTIVLSLTLLFMFSLFAGFILETTVHAENSLYEKIKKAAENSDDGLTQVENQVDSAAEKLIGFVRRISITVSIGILISMAYSLFWSRNAQGIAEMKGRVILFLLGIFVAFNTEAVLGTILNFFGVDLSSL